MSVSLLLLSNHVVFCSNYLDAGDINAGRGGNDVGLVDTTERDTVELVWAGDEQKTAIELLQENDTLAAVATGQQDKDGTRRDAGAESGLGDLLGDLLLLRLNILSRVETRSLFGRNNALAAVLCALDLDGLVGLCCSHFSKYT